MLWIVGQVVDQLTAVLIQADLLVIVALAQDPESLAIGIERDHACETNRKFGDLSRANQHADDPRLAFPAAIVRAHRLT